MPATDNARQAETQQPNFSMNTMFSRLKRKTKKPALSTADSESKKCFDAVDMDTGMRTLSVLVRRDERKEALALIDSGDDLDVNVGGDDTDPPVFFAIKLGAVEVVQAIIRHPTFDPTLKDGKDGAQAHLHAAQHGLLDVFVELLQDPRVFINASNADGMRSLDIAISNGNMLIVGEILGVRTGSAALQTPSTRSGGGKTWLRAITSWP